MEQKEWRLPDGSYTMSKAEYRNTWRDKGKIITELTGLKVNGFDYGLVSFTSLDGEKSITLPSWFIDLFEGNDEVVKKEKSNKKSIW